MEGDVGPSTSIYLETGFLEKLEYGFRAYYEKVGPGAAQFLRDAIHACA
ncbi:TipAS antibiotic-recognition domain-containing protein [Collinsella tanakaei]|nr:hypothetical protein [Collinsella tanakaei]MDM8301504.1 hypothetical protein [Collinsella tanakaei]